MTGMEYYNWVPRIAPSAIIARGSWLQAAVNYSRAECMVIVLATPALPHGWVLFSTREHICDSGMGPETVVLVLEK